MIDTICCPVAIMITFVEIRNSFIHYTLCLCGCLETEQRLAEIASLCNISTTSETERAEGSGGYWRIAYCNYGKYSLFTATHYPDKFLAILFSLLAVEMGILLWLEEGM
jgi:hypothetical protein